MVQQSTLLLVLLGGLLVITTLIPYTSLLFFNDVIVSSTAPPPKKISSKLLKAARAGSKGTALNSVTVRIRDFVPLPPPHEVLVETRRRRTRIDYDSIATKWELPTGGIKILEEIQSRKVGFDYNQTTDILALRHPPKSGGTSFSVMLREIFSNERVIPGSDKSGYFNFEKFSAAVKDHPPTDPFWSSMATVFTHTGLRPNSGPTKDLLDYFREQAPALREKRFRLMTIVRRPLDLAASGFYETQCKIGTFAYQRGPGHVPGSCPTVNLTDVMLKNIEHKSKMCDEKGWDQGNCQSFKKNGGEKLFEHCGSFEKLFEKGSIHNMHYRSHTGDFPRPPELGDVEDGNGNGNGINLTPTLEDVSLYTLRDLGGLIDFNPVYKEDFVWFAITERFKESMCLFYYRFEVEPVEEKRSLVKKCRPLAFWEEKHKKFHEDNEQFDYTVWRAANAIMDVRMEDMRLEIKDRLNAGEKLEDIPYLGPGCYAEEN